MFSRCAQITNTPVVASKAVGKGEDECVKKPAKGYKIAAVREPAETYFVAITTSRKDPNRQADMIGLIDTKLAPNAVEMPLPPFQPSQGQKM